jgi:branched-chain amino acid transport system substrate-binding protein
MTTNPTIAKATAVSAAVAVAAVWLAGCASGGSGVESGERVHVYVSMPLHGPNAANGRDVVDGARLALADAEGKAGVLEVRATYLDDASGTGADAGWSPAAAADNARRATEDSAAIAYIGDFDSGATRFSLPITNEAHLLQVSPASAAVDLVQPFLGAGDQVPEEMQPTGERTFGRVIPSDEVQARAGAIWAQRLGSTGVMVIRGHSKYDEVVGAAFREEAGSLGLRMAGSGEELPGSSTFDLAYAAIESSDRLGALPAISRVMGTDALLPPLHPAVLADGRQPRQLLLTSAAQDPSQLPSSGQRFIRDFRERYRRQPGRYAAYGYEAMAVVLDSIERAGDAGDDRDAVIDAFFETTDRRSILGTYSIDDVGNTTLNRLAGYRLVDGQAGFDTGLSVTP